MYADGPEHDDGDEEQHEGSGGVDPSEEEILEDAEMRESEDNTEDWRSMKPCIPACLEACFNRL